MFWVVMPWTKSDQDIGAVPARDHRRVLRDPREVAGLGQVELGPDELRREVLRHAQLDALVLDRRRPPCCSESAVIPLALASAWSAASISDALAADLKASTPNPAAATVGHAMPVATLLPTAAPSPPIALSPLVMAPLMPCAACVPAAGRVALDVAGHLPGVGGDRDGQLP